MGEFAKLFKTKRKELNISQAEMAERLHVTKQAVSKWENAKAYPDVSLMPQIAEMFNMSVDELLTGNKPEEKVVIKEVEKEVIKEVTKPMPFRKILAIVAPIVLGIVLASALMGVYIPKAIAKNIPPIPEPEPPTPEIVYTEVYMKGKSNTDDSCFQAPLIDGKAYYALNMQSSSDYTLYITAPQGAVATLNGEVIAEFDTAKTMEYSQYFKLSEFIVNERYDANDTVPIFYQYSLYKNITLDDDGVIYDYVLVIDLTACDDQDKLNEKQQVVVKQHLGFNNIIIPAHGTYIAAIPTSTSGTAEAYHYIIKSEGIKFVRTYALDIANNGMLFEAINQMNYMCEPTSDFFLIDYPGCAIQMGFQSADYDWQIGFMNQTDRDIELEIDEIKIEEKHLGEEIKLESNGVRFYHCVYKIIIDNNNTRFMYKNLGKPIFDMTAPIFINKEGCYAQWYQRLDTTNDGWNVFESSNVVDRGVYYFIICTRDREDVTIVIDDVFRDYLIN